MKLKPARLGADRTGSLVAKDNPELKKKHLAPEGLILLWICTGMRCTQEHVTVSPYLDQARKQHKIGGGMTTHDMRTCPGCGGIREPHAVLSMVKVEVETPKA